MGYLRYETPVSVDTSFDGVMDDTKTPEVFNLDRAIQTYAWRRYMKAVRYPRRLTKLKERHFFRFNWDNISFRHATSMTRIEADESVLNPITRQSQKQTTEGTRHSYLSLDIQAPQVINSAQFENNTGKDRLCVFKTDTETKAKLTVEFNEQYSLGDRSNIELTIPGRFISPTNNVDCRLLATNIHSQRFKETITWAVDAEIPVKTGFRTCAMLSAQGQKTVADFEVLSTMTLRKQWLPVQIFRKSDNAVVFTCYITDLHQVFRRYQGPQLCLTSTCADGRHLTKHVSFVSRGQCTITGWTDVQVFVTAEEMKRREQPYCLVEKNDVVL